MSISLSQRGVLIFGGNVVVGESDVTLGSVCDIEVNGELRAIALSSQSDGECDV